MKTDTILLLLIAGGVGYYLYRQSQAQTPAPVQTAPTVVIYRSDLQRMPQYQTPGIVPVLHAGGSPGGLVSSIACGDGMYLGSNLIGQPTCMPIGAVS